MDIKEIVKTYSTVGLLAKHKELGKETNIIAKVVFDVYGDDDVEVYAVYDETGEKVEEIPSINITRRALSILPDDPYKDVVFARAAFKLLSLKVV